MLESGGYLPLVEDSSSTMTDAKPSCGASCRERITPARCLLLAVIVISATVYGSRYPKVDMSDASVTDTPVPRITKKMVEDRIARVMEDSENAKSFVDDPQLAARLKAIRDKEPSTPAPIVDENRNEEEVIHISIPLGGSTYTARMEVLIKSIMLFHDGKVHFHLFGDKMAMQSMTILLQTWRLNNVLWSMYDMDAVIERMDWVPDVHPAHPYSISKLILHDLLPLYVEKVITLDSDMLLLRDISMMAAHFQALKGKALVATAEELFGRNDWNKELPRRERGENLGMSMLNLKGMREVDWNGIWSGEMLRQVRKFGLLKFSEQDIISSLAIYRPELHHRLPCKFNFQLHDWAMHEHCYKTIGNRTEEIVVAHWPGHPKFTGTWQRTPEFNPLYHCMERVAGGLFSAPLPKNAPEVYTTTIFINDYKKEESKTTVIAHSSFENFTSILHNLNSTWTGPIVLCVTGMEREKIALRLYMDWFSRTYARSNIAVHFIYYKNARIPLPLTKHMWEIAVEYATTPFVLLATGLQNVKVSIDDLRKFTNMTDNSSFRLLRDAKNNATLSFMATQHLAQRIIAEERWNDVQGFAEQYKHFKFTTSVSPITVKPYVPNKNATLSIEASPELEFCEEEFRKRKALMSIRGFY